MSTIMLIGLTLLLHYPDAESVDDLYKYPRTRTHARTHARTQARTQARRTHAPVETMVGEEGGRGRERTKETQFDSIEDILSLCLQFLRWPALPL